MSRRRKTVVICGEKGCAAKCIDRDHDRKRVFTNFVVKKALKCIEDGDIQGVRKSTEDIRLHLQEVTPWRWNNSVEVSSLIKQLKNDHAVVTISAPEGVANDATRIRGKGMCWTLSPTGEQLRTFFDRSDDHDASRLVTRAKQMKNIKKIARAEGDIELCYNMDDRVLALSAALSAHSQGVRSNHHLASTPIAVDEITQLAIQITQIQGEVLAI